MHRYAHLYASDDQPPDALGEAAKARAAAEGRTFTSLVEEGLRAVLEAAPATKPTAELPRFGNADERPLIDLSDRDALWEILDADGYK